MPIFRARPASLCLLVVAILFTGASTAAQSLQTLPRGYDSGLGGSMVLQLFFTGGSESWQWHYDAAQFNATSEIVITQLYVRTFSNSQPLPFNYPSLEITLGSSPTDYSVAGDGVVPGHAAVFTANLGPDAVTVRPAAPWTNPAPTLGWHSLGMVTPYSYNPALGRDLVVYLRNCGTIATWGQTLFGAAGGPNQVGGNQYGTTAGCAAASATTSGNELVPVIRIQYTERNRLAVSQSGPGVGDLAVSLTNLATDGFEGFTLLSKVTSLTAGGGFMVGIVPDALTWAILGFPYFPGNPFHYRTTDVGLFPRVPFAAPPGSVSTLSGTAVDFVAFLVDAQGRYVGRSNVVRLTLQ